MKRTAPGGFRTRYMAYLKRLRELGCTVLCPTGYAYVAEGHECQPWPDPAWTVRQEFEARRAVAAVANVSEETVQCDATTEDEES